MLPKLPGRNICRSIRKLTLLSDYHPDSFNYFISYPAILAERQKQVLAGGKYVLHPFSFISLLWNTFMTVINISHMVIAPLRLCYIFHSTPYPSLNILDYVLLALDCICLMDIIIGFNTGFQEGHASNVVMTRSRIACHYLCTWFLVDFISCLPLAFVMLFFKMNHMYLMVPQYMPLLRCAKIVAVKKNLTTFVKIFTRSYIWQRGVQLTMIFMITMHWCTCAIFLPPITYYYLNGNMTPGYCSFLKSQDGDLWKIEARDRYRNAMFICFSAFFGTGYSIFQAKHPGEIVVNSMIILYSSMFMVYMLVFLLKIYMINFNSTMRYNELMNQVEKYMRHKQFPIQLKRRVRDFYKYRYHEKYFKQETSLDCLSDQLRNEITLHTCHKLINKVALFDGLPASVVGTVLGCLTAEVFMPNDLIVRGGDIGNCMYFISTGTVAVYSLKGAEVCHLEDGAHFGEVALLMKDNKRVATVIAVEITQVYRLDAADFRDFITTYQELYERVEVLASKRMHETVLIDEAFRLIKNAI